PYTSGDQRPNKRRYAMIKKRVCKVCGIEALANAGNQNSATISDAIVIDTILPGVPTNYLSTGSTATQARITWNNNSDLKYYYLERTSALGTTKPTNNYDTYAYSQIAKIDADTHGFVSNEAGDTINSSGNYIYTDNSLTADNYYLYRIKTEHAVNYSLGFIYFSNNSTADSYYPGGPNLAPEPPATITPSASSINLSDVDISDRKISVDFSVYDNDRISDISSVLFSLKKVGAVSDTLSPTEMNAASASATNFSATRIATDSKTYSYHTEYTFDRNLEYGDYTITIRTLDSIGSGNHDVTKTATIAAHPEIIGDLQVAGYSANKIDLSWSNPRSGYLARASEGIGQYKIYMSSDEGLTWPNSVTVSEGTYFNAHSNTDNKYHFRWGEDASTSALAVDTSYRFKLGAIDSNSNEGASTLASPAS
ncbi:hypothetical protein LCGC14_2748090, partial [marine sediment metagenome]